MELLNNVYAWFNQLHIRFLSKYYFSLENLNTSKKLTGVL